MLSFIRNESTKAMSIEQKYVRDLFVIIMV